MALTKSQFQKQIAEDLRRHEKEVEALTDKFLAKRRREIDHAIMYGSFGEVEKHLLMRANQQEESNMRIFQIAAYKRDENGQATEIILPITEILARGQRDAELMAVQKLGDVDLNNVEIIAVPFGQR